VPLTAFVCPETAPTAGQKNTFAHCLHTCPHKCLPKSVLHIIVRTETGNEHVGDMVSPTALSGCARRLKLTRSEDYAVEPERLYSATRGSLYHGFVENQDIPDVTTEQRIYKYVTQGEGAPWLISGRVDFYDRAEKSIEDFKTIADKGTYILFNKGAKPEHIWQLNLYRWLAHGGHLGAPDGPQVFWPVQKLQLHYCLMNRVISTGKVHIEEKNEYRKPGGLAFNKLKAGQFAAVDKPYGLEKKRERFPPNARGFAKTKITIDIPPVPIYTFDKVEKYLAERGPRLVRGFRDPDYIPPGVIGNRDAEWECSYCETREACARIEEAESVVQGLANLPAGSTVAAA
jgi:hypothetical protein